MNVCKNEVLVDGDKLNELFKKYNEMKTTIDKNMKDISELNLVNNELSKSNNKLLKTNAILKKEISINNKKLEEVIYKLDLSNTFKDNYKNKVECLELTKQFKISIDEYI